MPHNGDTPTTQRAPSLIVRDTDGDVFIYHRVLEQDDFNRSARILFGLVQEASLNTPGPRYLMLTIDGHRAPDGDFDYDMTELQVNFIIGFLGQYLTAISTPLLTESGDVYLLSTIAQLDEAPDKFEIEDQS